MPFDNYVLDFASHRERLVIEVDGSQHQEKRQRAHDEARTRVIEARGYLIVRYTNYQVLKNLDGVMDHLLEILKERHRTKFTAMPQHIGAEIPPPDPASLRFAVSTAPQRGR